MKRTNGFALVASLIILVVIAALGVGATFLTDMNLRIAENARTQTLARYNAEAGLDTAFVLLARTFQETGDLPDDAATFRSAYDGFETSEYSLAGYERFGDGTARVAITGVGPRSARYDVEGYVEPVEATSSTPEGYSLFGEGFVARSDIDLAGNGTFDINFWSGGNIDLRAGSLAAGRTARANGDTCKFKDSTGRCETGATPPAIEDPDFDALRNDVIANAEEDFLGFSMGSCPSSGVSYNGSNTVVCVPPNSTLTVSGNVENLVVIGDETTTVIMDAVAGTDDESEGVTVASGTVTFGSNAEFYGTNTIIAQNDLEFGKDVVSYDGTARTFIVTEGNFELSGTGATDIFASFWVGGTFDVRGTPDTFRGSVVSGSTIFRAGGGSFHTIRPPEELDNRYVPTDPSSEGTYGGVKVLGRR